MCDYLLIPFNVLKTITSADPPFLSNNCNLASSVAIFESNRIMVDNFRNSIRVIFRNYSANFGLFVGLRAILYPREFSEQFLPWENELNQSSEISNLSSMLHYLQESLHVRCNASATANLTSFYCQLRAVKKLNLLRLFIYKKKTPGKAPRLL